MQRRIPESSKTDITNGAEPIRTGAPMLQTLTGGCMPVHKPIIMTIPGDGDLLGAGTVAITHIGAGTVAGAGVEVCPGVGVVHSDGAGEALSDGAALTGDILLIGEDTMIRSGAATMEVRGDTAATGVVAIMPLYTEEAERAEEVS